jgi:hypothetical protein
MSGYGDWHSIYFRKFFVQRVPIFYDFIKIYLEFNYLTITISIIRGNSYKKIMASGLLLFSKPLQYSKKTDDKSLFLSKKCRFYQVFL